MRIFSVSKTPGNRERIEGDISRNTSAALESSVRAEDIREVVSGLVEKVSTT